MKLKYDPKLQLLSSFGYAKPRSTSRTEQGGGINGEAGVYRCCYEKYDIQFE